MPHKALISLRDTLVTNAKVLIYKKYCLLGPRTGVDATCFVHHFVHATLLLPLLIPPRWMGAWRSWRRGVI